MDTEIQRALIAAGALVLGALIAVGSSAWTAAVGRQTARETHQRNVEDARSTWLRDERQRAYVAFLSTSDAASFVIFDVHISPSRVASKEDTQRLFQALAAASNAGTELRLLGASGSEKVGVLHHALGDLFAVIADYPGPATDEIEHVWDEQFDRCQSLRFEVLKCAQRDLGITKIPPVVTN